MHGVYIYCIPATAHTHTLHFRYVHFQLQYLYACCTVEVYIQNKKKKNEKKKYYFILSAYSLHATKQIVCMCATYFRSYNVYLLQWCLLGVLRSQNIFKLTVNWQHSTFEQCYHLRTKKLKCLIQMWLNLATRFCIRRYSYLCVYEGTTFVVVSNWIESKFSIR